MNEENLRCKEDGGGDMVGLCEGVAFHLSSASLPPSRLGELHQTWNFGL